MKILAFTDSHGSRQAMRKIKEKIAQADIIICAGDFTSWGNNAEVILNEMNSWGKQVFIIPGNHEEQFDLKDLCLPFNHITEIDRALLEHEHKGKRYIFAGYGGGGFSHETPLFEVFARKLKTFVAKSPAKQVLVLHQPPFGTAADFLPYGHVGNETFSNVIARDQPDLVLCGHIHECFGEEDHLGKSRIVNPGPEGKIIEL